MHLTTRFHSVSFFLEFFFVLTPPPRVGTAYKYFYIKNFVNFFAKPEKNRPNKNAFQWDAYRTLVDRIYQHALREVCLWSQEGLPRGVSLPLVPGGVCLWSGGGAVYISMQWGRHPPCGQTDTCENITFANFVYGR